MGFAFGRHKRDVDAEKHLKRLHATTPWIESPLKGADDEKLVFAQRHEANSAELFYDLFFVANLATFTTYHSITDMQYLVAYIGFFAILWSTWFQSVLHDVRFARDSIYERVCKTIQFITFVGLALVGSNFNPTKKGSNTNFRILCYVLVISRALLAIQYLVVLFYIAAAKFSKLFLPLGLIVGIYSIAAIVFGVMTPAFQEVEKPNRAIYSVWYVVMILESAGVVIISCIWRMLSFKKTHLMERMSLLTLIVIGEGAIGVTKTVSRMMGKSGLDPESCGLIMCIIMVLVLIWALYFDNFPHGHYGTIRQQIWSLLHFPLQLAIVGVVEGSQQVALARYVLKNYIKIEKSIVDYCVNQNLDGAKLRDSLYKLVDYWQFDSKIETYGFAEYIGEIVDQVGNSTGICSPANATEYSNTGEWPFEFYNITMSMFDGVFQGLGMKLPIDKLEMSNASEIAVKSWKIVYLYYWISFCLLIATLIIFLFLIRRHKADLFDFVSVIARLVALIIGGILIALVANQEALFTFIGSPGVLPTCLALLFLILVFDKISAVFCNWRLLKSGQPYALEREEHEHHEGGHGHGEAHEHAHASGHAHHDSMASHRKSARWSTYSDTEPLTGATSYEGGGQAYVMSPLMSPPMMSPPVPSPNPLAPSPSHAPGGYMPVSGGQNYGA
ncbi:hypothetical protein EJ04DRAFT_507599 [Polyplosphaeria fusca]|uniref:Bacterial low temperature requirement A protein-domain-containing protein n=1 Tax=Polyplosphaeria fusca TaxID=682080 RepID=A0A9P4RBS7_9PLEO|nr:hypothetical protein EJ04DRAFT_507599 [Polyplosphaeria fusca]